MAFSVGPENFLFVQVDAELTVFEGGHGMTPFVVGFVLVFWYLSLVLDGGLYYLHYTICFYNLQLCNEVA